MKYDTNAIRNYFGIYENAFLAEFGRKGFDQPGGRHAPIPFLGLNNCIGQLVRDGTIPDKPVGVLGSGDARVNVALNTNERDSYGLEEVVSFYKLGRLTIDALRGAALTRPKRPIVLGHGNFFDLESYRQFGLSFADFSTLYHNDGTGDYRHVERVARLVIDESPSDTVLLLANHLGIPFAFAGLSCKTTYRVWGGKNAVDGMWIHVYKKAGPIEDARPRKKHAHTDLVVSR